LYVGLDVHKDSITIAVALVALEGRDGAQLIGRFPNNITTLQRHFAKWLEGSTRSGKPLISDLGYGPVELKIACEAGPCGFVLYRRLTQLGYDCQVVAPSLIPQSAGDRVKTDKRDAKKLARGIPFHHHRWRRACVTHEQNMERELENWHLKPVVQALLAFKTPELENPEPAAQSIRKTAQTPPAPQQDHRRRRARTQLLHLGSRPAHASRRTVALSHGRCGN
ncbi:MAG: hypothetical protein KDN22_24025, partial [Verrucomicrobiae bacterium]|nr:hypothetical protein [Verrucomicrobiae bacterium]